MLIYFFPLILNTSFQFFFLKIEFHRFYKAKIASFTFQTNTVVPI
jgi:hypothetical protein